MFKLTSEYQPTGDQPEAIRQLTEGVRRGDEAQVLLGVTGSGKTFTMANVIQNLGRPTLILSHNKTLAAQLYSEMKAFFPENAVEYYVSYYDYYQPEAYIASTDTYIEKDLSINDNIDRLRLGAVSALLSGRRDVIVVSSVSCIYGMGGPTAMSESVITIARGDTLDRNDFLRRLVAALYVRNDIALERGCFRVKGDTVDVYMAYSTNILRITWWDNEIESISELDSTSYQLVQTFDRYSIYPANLFVSTPQQTTRAIRLIQDDLMERVDYFLELGDEIKAQRIKERVEYDMEMIKELGHCAGIENYSRYFDGRSAGERPYCLFDFFPKDFLLFVDESHVTIPQLRAMYNGDRQRKQSLVEYGFRLPAAFDNRPLRFDEFEEITHQTIYVSATPADYELQRAEGVVVEQVIRPTGLLDPDIEVRPTSNQIADLMNEIEIRAAKDERVLVTTLTKRMAEETTQYFLDHEIRAAYIHSDVATLDRIEILQQLRAGLYDVLVGVNLLREGLDLPEVSLVAILDADKEGFLRSHRSLTQTAGRAARNVEGKVIMYADTITESMQHTITDTQRRREMQIAYNQSHGITPQQIVKAISTPSLSAQAKSAQSQSDSHSVKPRPKATPATTPQYAEQRKAYIEQAAPGMVADPLISSLNRDQIARLIVENQERMKQSAQSLDFIQAAQYRDEIIRLQNLLDTYI